MPPSPWFFLRDGQQFGPWTGAQLKQLAEVGQLAPDDQVWQEGMKYRVAARMVRGLFAADAPAPGGGAIAATAGSEPTAVPAADNPLMTLLPSEPSAAVDAVDAADTVPAEAANGASSEPVEPGEPATPVATDKSTAAQRPAAGDATPTAVPRHALDALLELLRQLFGTGLAENATRLFSLIGHYGLYVVMLLWLGLAGRQVTQGGYATAAWGLAAMGLLWVLQYTAFRSVRALQRAQRAVPIPLSSRASLDCLALLAMLFGLVALFWLTIDSVLRGPYQQVLIAMEAFALCQFVSIVAIDPSVVNISINPAVAATFDGLGLMWFLLRLTSKATAVAYGLGVVWGGLELARALYLSFTSSAAGASRTAAAGALTITLGAAALPLAGYLLYLPLQVLLEVVRGWMPPPPRLGRGGDEITG